MSLNTDVCLQCGKIKVNYPIKLFCSKKCVNEYYKHEDNCELCMNESEK